MKNGFIKAVMLSIAAVGSLCSQPISLHRNDHLFAASGHSMISITTGIPYVGITEYAYGFSDRFSLGFMAGVTPHVEGYGLRVRAILSQPSEKFRIYFRAPLFYYPKTKDLGGDPWVLGWPVISGEWTVGSGTRVSVGGGAVVTSCYHSLLRHLGLRKSHVKAAEEDNTEEKEHKGFMGGVWNTLHAGIAFPVTSNITFQSEASLVMSGIKIAGNDWVGGPPVILVTGFSYSF